MWKRKIIGTCASILLLIPGLAAAQAQSTAGNLLVGYTKIETLSSYKGPELLARPDRIIICDFSVPPDAITMDNSIAARLHGHGPVGQLLHGGSTDDSSPEKVTERVQDSFAAALIKELEKAAVPAERSGGPDARISANTLIVCGEFTTISEGDKTKRLMVGFGRGASDVQAHVRVLLTTDTQPIVLSEFILKSDSGKKPGAAATLGVGSAAMAGASAVAGSATDRKETVEGDAHRMANAVAKQIEALITARNWIPEQQPQAR